MAKYLVTGYAGFIGYHLTKRLLEDGHQVVGIDNFDDYYSTALKSYRIGLLRPWREDGSLECRTKDICDIRVFGSMPMNYDAIYHLAAVPGVRNSIAAPDVYVRNNIMGSINILEAAGEHGIRKVILASSSSVYGDATASYGSFPSSHSLPIACSENIKTGQPLSPYAMTKRAMELAGYAYHKLYGYDVIIPRFFTVYGPAGRPDMAYFKFIQRLRAGKSIEVYGDGMQLRDFTYIDDIVDGLIGLPKLEGYEIINLGSGNPLSLITMIDIISRCLGIGQPNILYSEPQPGDVWATYANIEKAKTLLHWVPIWCLEDGIQETVDWFEKEFHKIRVKLLHQASEESDHCRYCGKAMMYWKSMEECPERKS